MPSSFKESDTETGTTRVFKHNGSDMVITCETHTNTGHQSVAARMAEMKTGINVSYEASGSNWYVLSWAEGNTVHYVKEYVTSDQFNSIEFVYTKSETCDKLLEEIVPTFQLK